MTDESGLHAPSPEFRASLKREVARTFRAAAFDPSPRSRAKRFGVVVVAAIGAVVALAAGLAVGTSTGYAAARVDGDRKIGAMAANAVGATTQLVALRLDLAHVRVDLAQRAAMKGAAREALLAAESELRAMEASAERIERDLTQGNAAPAPAAESNVPMKRALALTCDALALGTPASTRANARPQGVPIVDLPPAKTKTPTTFGGIIGIREVSGGKVLVNDAGRHRLWMYDTTLATSRIVFDSSDGTATSYGPIGVPLIPYLGDSSIMADVGGGPGTLLVLDGRGQVARTLALPSALGAGAFASGMAGTDSRGRLIYVQSGLVHMPPPGTVGVQQVFVDSNPVLRADLEARRTDTIGHLAKNQGEFSQIDHTDPTKIIRTVFVNPLPAPDEWAVLSDGTVAFVRGHDYHIDWVRPNGSTNSTAKLPFDWKRLTDEDKQKLIDSAKAAHARQNTFADSVRRLPPPPPPMLDDAAGGRQRTGGGAGVTRSAYDAMGNLWVPLTYEVVAPKDIADYYPAIRKGAVMADRDNHLWVLPTTSAQSRNGELVYDVINTKGELFQRVRVPAGRQVAGFGRGGVVYLLVGDKTNGFYLERARLPARAQ